MAEQRDNMSRLNLGENPGPKPLTADFLLVELYENVEAVVDGCRVPDMYQWRASQSQQQQEEPVEHSIAQHLIESLTTQCPPHLLDPSRPIASEPW